MTGSLQRWWSTGGREAQSWETFTYKNIPDTSYKHSRYILKKFLVLVLSFKNILDTSKKHSRYIFKNILDTS